MKLVEDAQSSKAPIQNVADSISNIFVPCIIAFAILSWIIWFTITYTAEYDEFRTGTERF